MNLKTEILSLQIPAKFARFSNKPCLHFKLGFFATQTSVVYDANKACFENDAK